MDNQPANSTDSQSEKPPQGDYKKAEEYVSKFTKLIALDKIHVIKTDLKKFDPTSLQNHYRIDLIDYNVEVSHSKNPNGKDSYIMLFTNVGKIDPSNLNQKVILAYIHLTEAQFQTFRSCAETQLEKKRKEEEAKRFKAAVEPVDRILENLEVKKDADNPKSNGIKEYDIEPKFSIGPN